jgi:hypothetical protein
MSGSEPSPRVFSYSSTNCLRAASRSPDFHRLRACFRGGVEQQVGAFGARLEGVRGAAPAEPGAVLDANVDGEVAHGVEGVAGGKAIGRLAVEGRQLLGVAEEDALFLPRLQGEDAHLEGGAVEPFQQGGVLLLVDDALIDLPAVIALDHAAFVEPAIDVHGQARQRGVGRQREVEGAFEPAVRVVEVGLIDGGAGEAVLDVNVHVIFPQGQAGLLAVRVADDEAAARVGAGGHQRAVGIGHQLPHPAQQVRDARGSDGLLSLRRQLLPGRQRSRESGDLHLSAGHDNAGAVVADADGEAAGAAGHFALRRADDELSISGDLSGLHEHLAGGHFQLALGGALQGGLLVDEQDEAIAQADAAFLSGGGADLLADRQDLGGAGRRPRPAGQHGRPLAANERQRRQAEQGHRESSGGHARQGNGVHTRMTAGERHGVSPHSVRGTGTRRHCSLPKEEKPRMTRITRIKTENPSLLWGWFFSSFV